MKYITLFFLLATLSSSAQSPPGDCKCDTGATELIIASGFSRQAAQDTVGARSEFYKLSASENRKLWYKDVESPYATVFTAMWNDYVPTNYHASHLDFCDEYANNKDIELAFQFGPNIDLWAYHIFVIRKMNCCYLVTHSYFRHARFTYKSYAVMNRDQLDSLHSILEKANKIQVDKTEPFSYRGYFADNRKHQKYYLDFASDTVRVKQPKKDPENRSEPDTWTTEYTPQIRALFDFVDKKVRWKDTYD